MSNLTDWGLSDNYTDPSTISAFFKIGNKESYDIRIVGSFSDPCTGVQGWEAWKDTVNEQGADVRVPERVGIKDKALLNRYDINASREGEGYDTEYTLNALPAEDGSGLGPCPVAQQALEESTIDLRQLFVGGDIMTPLEEKTPDASEKPRVERSDLKPLELVRNAIESATSYELLDEARMLKDSYVKRGDISKAEQMTLVSLEAKVKERLQEVA